MSPFALDTFEVTVQRFLPFFENYPESLPREGQGAHPRIPGSGWQAAWTQDERCTVNNVDFERCQFGLPPTRDQLRELLTGNYSTFTDDPARVVAPINTTNWYLAFAFCIWDGGRLPTEAEWELAAAGGEENRLYPWGAAAPSVERASFGCLFSGAEDCHTADLPRPGLFPDGRARWGHHDMAGGVGEWVLDAYALYPETSCVDCARLEGGDARIARGGMFRQKASDLRVARRVFLTARQGESGVGIRCARDL